MSLQPAFVANPALVLQHLARSHLAGGTASEAHHAAAQRHSNATAVTYGTPARRRSTFSGNCLFYTGKHSSSLARSDHCSTRLVGNYALTAWRCCWHADHPRPVPASRSDTHHTQQRALARCGFCGCGHDGDVASLDAPSTRGVGSEAKVMVIQVIYRLN